ncbi:MAG TPA: uroporphyrinogen decarboxylase family protein [Ruminiclostridium sp.]
MKLNMKNWLKEMLDADVKKAMPVLSFPSITLMGISVVDLISNSEKQSMGMKLIAEKCDTAASLSMMDLSIEAEAFGAQIRALGDEVPTVIGQFIKNEDDAKELKVPQVGAGRTGVYIEAIGKASKLITDRPVFAGVIGPFSLAGRLMDMTEIMINCQVEPDMVHETLKKTTQFIIEYIKAYKAVGANGVVLAEPAAGLLSPKLIAEFSSKYVKEIVEAVQDDNFILIYHNCGNTIPLIDSISSVGAAAYHFGNAIKMSRMLELIPSDTIALGNVDPSSQFRNGTPESVREATLKIMKECCQHKNFIISSGCDIPPLSSWENISAFFDAVNEFYKS